jgi:hypothetical protein
MDDCLSESQSWQLLTATYDEARSDAAAAFADVAGGKLDALCCAVRSVLVDLAFALGPKQLATHAQLLRHVHASDWAAAARQLAASLWYASEAAAERGPAHSAALRRGCAQPDVWEIPPRGAAVFQPGGALRASYEEASRWVAVWTATPDRPIDYATVRGTAVSSMGTFHAHVQHASELRATQLPSLGALAADPVCPHADTDADLTAQADAARALHQLGGRLGSLCCRAQSLLIDIANGAGLGQLQQHGAFVTALALSRCPRPPQPPRPTSRRFQPRPIHCPRTQVV